MNEEASVDYVPGTSRTGNDDEIDLGMRHVVKAFNDELGLPTVSSCEGHLYEPSLESYLQLSVPPERLPAVLAALEAGGYPVPGAWTGCPGVGFAIEVEDVLVTVELSHKDPNHAESGQIMPEEVGALVFRVAPAADLSGRATPQFTWDILRDRAFAQIIAVLGNSENKRA